MSDNYRFHWFAITIVLPLTTEHGDVVNDPTTGQPIYQVNYFCRLDKDTIPGVVLNEWDTDKRYAYRFPDAISAENFRRVVLESLDGTKVEEMKPEQINNVRRLPRLLPVALLFISIMFASCATRPAYKCKGDGCERYHKPFKKFKA